VLEESERSGRPADAPKIVVVQTIAEDRGFPVPVRAPDAPLPPARLSLPAVGRLLIMPCCELLSWPAAVVLWFLGAQPNRSSSD